MAEKIGILYAKLINIDILTNMALNHSEDGVLWGRLCFTIGIIIVVIIIIRIVILQKAFE
jgi:hypothetical protein